MSLGRVVGQKFWIHLPMTIEILVGPFPTDLVAAHFARMPPESPQGTFPLNAAFGEGRVAHFGAPTHSGPLLTHVFWSALSMAYI